MRGTSTYNDRLFRWGAALIGAYLVSEYRGEDGYFSLERLQSREFLIEYGSSTFIALVLVEIVSGMTYFLDRYFSWNKQFLLRSVFQLLLGVAVPAVVNFGLAAVYFFVFDVNILDTSYPTTAWPHVIVFIALFNACYVFRQSVLRPKAKQRDKTKIAPKRASLIAYRGSTGYSIHMPDIACMYRYLDQVYVYTLESEEYLFSESLDAIEKYSPLYFFRANRHLLVNLNTLISFTSLRNGRLLLTLDPAPRHEIATEISRDKAFLLKKRLPGLKERSPE